MTASLLNTTIEDRLTRHEDVLRSYKEKFEEHKRWLQGQRELPSFVTNEGGTAWGEGTLTEEESDYGGRPGAEPRSGVPVHDTLLEKGKLYEQKREAAREEAIRRELKQLRPTPKISKQGAAKMYEKPIEERFMELENKRRKDLKEAEQGRKEDAPQYSFTPTITRKGKQAAVRTSSSSRGSDQWKQRRDQKLEEARSRLVVESIAEMQSTPVINEHSQRLVEKKRRNDSAFGRSPHYNHADSLLERDRLSKLHLWEKYQRELAHQQPGNPKITPFAASLQRDGSVCERLYEQSFDKEERKNHLLQKKLSAEGTECYHTPRITMNAATLRREVPVEDDLLQRHERSKMRKEESMRQVLERERHLHHPAINPVSDEIASRLVETSRERLYGPKPDYSTLQQQYSGNPSRRSMSARERKRPSLDFHLRGERTKELSTKRVEALREQQEAKMMEDCTFKPRICRPPLELKSMDFHNRTMQRLKKKDEKLREARREREMKEEAECPFVPNVGYRVSDFDDGPVSAPLGPDGHALGFDEFVERQRAARRQQLEKEQGSWVTGKNWRNEPTVPQEFSLGRKDKPVRALQKPLSPPRIDPDDPDGDHSYEYEGGNELPQQGFFSEGTMGVGAGEEALSRNASIEQMQPQSHPPPPPPPPAGYPSYPGTSSSSYSPFPSYGTGGGTAVEPPQVPIAAWGAPYPTYEQM